MTMQQKLPRGFDKKELKKYAKTFFGFGSWKADYWLIGLEERGATEDKCEFRKRYHAWKEMKRDGLVDLRTFFEKCGIENPETPDWTNPTWRAIHCICREAGLCVGELCPCNSRWGGDDAVEGSSHVALIEAMPFPAPSTKEEGWPYVRWNQCGMKSRKACADKFLDARLKILAKKFEKHKPKVVITYGSDYARNHDIRDWISKISRVQSCSCEHGSVEGKKTFSHFRLKEIRWPRKGKSLLVCIAQPASFRGACIPFKLGNRIKKNWQPKTP